MKEICIFIGFHHIYRGGPCVGQFLLLFWKRHREAYFVILGACVLLAGFLSAFIYQLSAKERGAVAAREKSEFVEQEAKEAEQETKDLLNKVSYEVL